jgi:hypothetical protein
MLRICTLLQNKTLESISYTSKASGATPARCARAHPPEKGTQHQPMARNSAWVNLAPSQRTASEGVHLLLHKLEGYTRRVCSHAPLGKKQPNKPRSQQRLGQNPAKSIDNVQPLKEYTYSSTGLGLHPTGALARTPRKNATK